MNIYDWQDKTEVDFQTSTTKGLYTTKHLTLVSSEDYIFLNIRNTGYYTKSITISSDLPQNDEILNLYDNLIEFKGTYNRNRTKVQI